MKSITTLITVGLLAAPAAAAAQGTGDSPFGGPFVGIEGSYDSNQARKPTPAPKKGAKPAAKNTKKVKLPKEQGFGGRLYAGYDVVMGDNFLIGAEIGIGMTSGEMTLDANGKKKKDTKTRTSSTSKSKDKKKTKAPVALGVNEYRVDPGLTYDATARVGFLPSKNVLIYGRGGYRWLKTERFFGPAKAGDKTTSKKVTESGLTFGGGLEVALTDNLALRAEYNRTNFSRDFKQDKVSAGLTLRF